MNYILAVTDKKKTGEEIPKSFGKKFMVPPKNYTQISRWNLLIKTLNLYLEFMEYIGFPQKMRLRHSS